MANTVTLVLADHHVLFAEGLGMILGAEADLAVVDVAHHTCQAVELTAKHRLAVLSLDAQLPTGDLVETLAAVKAASPTTKALVLSGDAHPTTTAAVMASGADGVLAKAESSRQIATAVRKLAAGEQTMVMAPQPAKASGDPMVAAQVGTLTRREWEVLGLLAAGWSNRRIAEEYLLSIHTVRTHVQHVLVKLGVHSKLEAVAFAVEHGVVAAGSSRA
jgi:DNA-binding NarL/FixJ family response regulator